MCSTCARKKLEILLKLERIQIDSLDNMKLPLCINEERITVERLCEVFEFGEGENVQLRSGYMISSLWRALLVNPLKQRLFVGHLHQECNVKDKTLITENGFCNLDCPPFHDMVAVDQGTFVNVQKALNAFCKNLKRKDYGFRYMRNEAGLILEHKVCVGKSAYKMRYAAFFGVSSNLMKTDPRSKWMPYALTKSFIDNVEFDFVWALLFDVNDIFPSNLSKLK